MINKEGNTKMGIILTNKLSNNHIEKRVEKTSEKE
jgi:hypothetical protein